MMVEGGDDVRNCGVDGNVEPLWIVVTCGGVADEGAWYQESCGSLGVVLRHLLFGGVRDGDDYDTIAPPLL